MTTSSFRLIMLFLFMGNSMFSQCDFYEDYSSNAGWTQIGVNVEIANGRLNYLNGAEDGSSQRRVHTPLGTTLDSNDCWIAEFEFHPQQVGEKNSLPYSGHVILGITETTQEPFNDCTDVPCTGLPPGTTDGIIFAYNATNPPDGNIYFRIYGRDNGTQYITATTSSVIAPYLDTTYYLSASRTSPTQVNLSVYWDANRTNHLPTSPISFTIPSSITGLTTVQQGNIVRGETRRKLTGYLDNLCINWTNLTLSNPLVLPNDTALCDGDILQINIGRGVNFTYSWNNGSSDSVLVITNPGTYIASVKKNCQKSSDTLVVSRLEAPKKQLTDKTLCYVPNASLSFNASNATYLWNTGETTSSIYPTTSGLYSVEVSNACGTIKDEAYIEFENCDCEIVMPNIFTPNNDGDNDVFKPVSINGSCSLMLTIFNRWGGKVFETSETQFSWDAEHVSAGTYFWVLDYTSPIGETNTTHGTVTVIK